MTNSHRRLQLGAFDHVQPGWLNTDVTPHLFVARVPGLAWLLHRVGLIGEERYAAHRSGAFRSLTYLDVGRRFRFDTPGRVAATGRGGVVPRAPPRAPGAACVT